MHVKEKYRGQAHLLIAYGSSHPANASYSCLQLMLADSLPGVYLATVEGYPQLSEVLPRLRRQGVKEGILSPYMLLAGEPARHDMAACGENSWKQILAREGFQVKVELCGLGGYPAYQEIFGQRVRDCPAGQAVGG
ncbi:MAG: hypothetical protein GX039_00140 [Clostridia bacterium]|nr:hypothetical protein [Clostridia bacterium]